MVARISQDLAPGHPESETIWGVQGFAPAKQWPTRRRRYRRDRQRCIMGAAVMALGALAVYLRRR
jgi:hypothetical protein